MMQYIRSVPDRHWLFLLNSLVFILSSGQCTLGMNFIIRIFNIRSLMNEEDEDKMLVAWIVLTGLSFLCAAASTFGLVAAKRVSMDQLITYFAFVIVLVAPILLFTLMTFAYQTVFRAWLRHRWSTQSLDEVRRFFCEPKSTWDTLCRAGPLDMPESWTDRDAVLTSPTGAELTPAQRGNSFGVNEWCQWNFASLECQGIFQAALKYTTEWARFWLRASGVVSLLNMILLMINLTIVNRIVTPSIIMKYMSTKVNAMLILPGTGVLILGLDLAGRLLSTDTTEKGTDFRVLDPNIVIIGYLNFFTGLLILTTFLIGLNRERLGNKRCLHTYMLLLSVALALLVAAGSWCLVISFTIADTLEKEEWEGGSFACRANLYGCSNCEDDVSSGADQCTEWSRRNIIDYVQVYLQMGGLFSLTSVVYAGAGLVAAVRLNRNLRDYRCEYI
mmetsp:Transcript_89016/g.172439  ORF Transcript_89016/g.172439 Transcript_89016/m.172439 type:complete len:445 (+) Transcript_89016:115-1449(+)